MTGMDESFSYLGKEFNFSMSNAKIKENMETFIEDSLQEIDMLPVRSSDKIKIVNTSL